MYFIQTQLLIDCVTNIERELLSLQCYYSVNIERDLPECQGVLMGLLLSGRFTQASCHRLIHYFMKVNCMLMRI